MKLKANGWAVVVAHEIIGVHLNKYAAGREEAFYETAKVIPVTITEKARKK